MLNKFLTHPELWKFNPHDLAAIFGWEISSGDIYEVHLSAEPHESYVDIRVYDSDEKSSWHRARIYVKKESNNG